MTLLKKMEKITSKIPNQFYVIEKLTKLLFCSKKQLCFYCRILLLAADIAFICSATLNFDQVHFKPEQLQVLSPDSQVTIDTIHQTQDATNEL